MVEPGTGAGPDGGDPVDPRVAHTRRLVLAATVAELMETGFERISIDAIAERSGVARSTIYRNWSDRTMLLAEACRQLISSPSELAPADDLRGDLENLASLLVSKVTSDEWRCVIPSMVSAARHDEPAAELVALFSDERRAEVRTIFDRAVERGEIAESPAIDSALERFVAPFFFRGLMTQAPLDEAFVRSQVDATLDQVGLGP